MIALQPRPSFLLLLPIILLTIGIGWFLNKQIQKDHQEYMQKGLQYTLDEENAQHWLHQSFIPKTQILLRKHIKELIFYSGVILLAFVFVWSYIVVGFTAAITNTIIAFVLYACFIFYTLHADKWYRYFFKNVPKKYRGLQKNDWIYGYVILFPFTLFCYFIYLNLTYTGTFLGLLIAIPTFILIYTLVFVALFCGTYLYNEYKKEEERTLNDEIKKATEE
jgi:hypothetical protein